jgi:hypothetical protein
MESLSKYRTLIGSDSSDPVSDMDSRFLDGEFLLGGIGY